MKKWCIISAIVIVSSLIFIGVLINKPTFEDEMQSYYTNNVCQCCSVFLYKEIVSPNGEYYLKVNLAHSKDDGALMVLGLIGNTNKGGRSERHIFFDKCDNTVKATWIDGKYESNSNISAYWIDNDTICINGVSVSVDSHFDYRKN